MASTLNRALARLPASAVCRRAGIFSSSRATRPAPPLLSTFTDERLIGFSPEQLFDVVADVDNYSSFVPFCSGSRVIRREGAEGAEGHTFDAELAIEFFKVTERYTSRVTLDRPRHVNAHAISSKLFSHLSSDWRFKPGPSAQTCLLQFRIEFKVISSLYAPIIDHVLPEVTSQQVAAFSDRCKALYGAPQPLPA
jgi:coenzyme Q-binding protein COQ10